MDARQKLIEDILQLTDEELEEVIRIWNLENDPVLPCQQLPAAG